MTALLFVYGSLKSTAITEYSRRLAQEATFLGAAVTQGILYNLGSYPGMVLGVGNVYGELWRLHHPEHALRWLDAYEGINGLECDEYVRVQRMVQINHKQYPAWMYLYQGERQDAHVLPSGNWP
jgi:gamma-glutamylcyclotransferase (GGCT)/AIG2-like uncharacterized protein YtfP